MGYVQETCFRALVFKPKALKLFLGGGGEWKIFIGGTSRQFWKTYLELTPDPGLYLTPSSLPPMGKDGKQTTKTLYLSAYAFLRKLIEILQFTLNVSYKSLLENNLPTKMELKHMLCAYEFSYLVAPCDFRQRYSSLGLSYLICHMGTLGRWCYAPKISLHSRTSMNVAGRC